MMELTIDFVNTIYSGGVHAKENLPVLLTVALVFSSIFSLFSLHNLQGNAKVINYAGVVRGGGNPTAC